jgi:hypothetical protein
MMTVKTHLLLTVPADWTNDQRGAFFEEFVSDLLRPMRFQVTQRLRVTGMEIDVLAKGLDQPRTILVECKAQRDPLPADTISKLLGNVILRRADAGWLFSTSELTKDGLGQWEEIQATSDLASRFAWFPPSRLAEVLVDQGSVVDPKTLISRLAATEPGDVTLLIEPGRRSWLLEIVEAGVPLYYTVFDGPSGRPLDPQDAARVAAHGVRHAC